MPSCMAKATGTAGVKGVILPPQDQGGETESVYHMFVVRLENNDTREGLAKALKEQGTVPDRYLLLEVSPDLKARQRELLAKRHPSDMEKFVWIDRLPEKIRGMVIATHAPRYRPYRAAWS